MERTTTLTNHQNNVDLTLCIETENQKISLIKRYDNQEKKQPLFKQLFRKIFKYRVPWEAREVL